MSFKSKLKKVGKIALKVAPYAAGFIPGVGPLAAMAIGGLASGASKKLEGGSWKDAAMSGGLGAATGFGSGLAGKAVKGAFGAAKGIGPSADVVSKAAGGAGKAAASGAGKAAGGSALSKVGSIMGAVPLGLGAASAIGSLGGGGGNEDNTRRAPLAALAPSTAPNLATALRSGSRDAVRDQPFRRGYTVNTIDQNQQLEEGQEPTTTSYQMGPITSSYAKYAKKQYGPLTNYSSNKAKGKNNAA